MNELARLNAGPPPPRPNKQRRRGGAAAAAAASAVGSGHKENAGQVGAADSSSAASSSSVAAASSAASPASPSWSGVLCRSASFAPSDPACAWEVAEERDTFARFLEEHFRPLTQLDLLKLGLWAPIRAQEQHKARFKSAKQRAQQQGAANDTRSPQQTQSSTDALSASAPSAPSSSGKLPMPALLSGSSSSLSSSLVSPARRPSVSSAMCLSPLPFESSAAGAVSPSNALLSSAAASAQNQNLSAFVSPSPLIFEPKTDPSFIVPPLGVRTGAGALTASSALPSVAEDQSPPPAAASLSSSGASAMDLSDETGCFVPSIAEEPALLLQLGLTPPLDRVDQLQQLATGEPVRPTLPAPSAPLRRSPSALAAAAAAASAAAASAAAAAASTASTKSTSVFVLVSNNHTGRRPSRPSTPSTPRSASNANSAPSTPSAAHSSHAASQSFGMSFLPPGSGRNTPMQLGGALESVPESGSEPQSVLCEFTLTTVPAAEVASKGSRPMSPAVPVSADALSSSSLFTFNLSALQPTLPPPASAALLSVMPEVESLASAREEQLEAARRKRIRDAEAELRRREAEEEKLALEAELASRKKSAAAAVAAAAAASAAAASDSGLAPMDLDGEPVRGVGKSIKSAPMDSGELDVPELASAASDSLPSASAPKALSRSSTPAPSPLPSQSRLTTPVPTDPDQLLKELLSLQLQLSHQVAANNAARKSIIKRIQSSDLEWKRSQQDEKDRYYLAAYHRVARWQSIRLSMKAGTGDVTLPAALAAFHRNKYQYDTERDAPPPQIEGLDVNGNEIFLDTSTYAASVAQIDVELERALATEAFALDDYSVCSVCFATGPSLAALSEDDQSVDNSNPLIFCERCNMCAHLYCIGLPCVPDSTDWMCAWCVAHPIQTQRVDQETPTIKRATSINASVAAPTVPPPALAAAAPLISSPLPLPVLPLSVAPMQMPLNALPQPMLSNYQTNVLLHTLFGFSPMQLPSQLTMPPGGLDLAALGAMAGASADGSPLGSPPMSPTTGSMQRAQAKKQTATDKANRKQREKEAEVEAARLKLEQERAADAAKRAERREREANLPLPCCLCTVRGGALKPTDAFDVDIPGYLEYQQSLPNYTPRAPGAPPQRLWAHIVCALWLPRTTVDDVSTMQEIKGVRDAWKYRLYKHGLPPASLTASLPPNSKETSLTLSSSPSLSPSNAAFSTNAFALHSLSNLHMLSNMNPLNLMSNLNHAAAVTNAPANPEPFGAQTQQSGFNSGSGSSAFNANVGPFNNSGSNFGGVVPIPAVAVNSSPSYNSSAPVPVNNFIRSTPAATVNTLSASAFHTNAPFLLPLPPLPLSLPSSWNPLTSLNGVTGISGMHAAQAINTMLMINSDINMQQQQQQQSINNAAMFNNNSSSSNPSMLSPQLGGFSPSYSTSANVFSSAAVPNLMRSSSLPLPSSHSPLMLPAPMSNSPPLNSNRFTPALPYAAPVLSSAVSVPINQPINNSSSAAAAVAAPPKPAAPLPNGVCGLCKKSYGCCVYCSADLCSQSYHPLCAWYAGLYMRVETGSQSTDIRYYLYCSMHTPLKALAIELIEDAQSKQTDTSAQASASSTLNPTSAPASTKVDAKEPPPLDKKRSKKVHFEESAADPESSASPVAPAEAEPASPSPAPAVESDADRESTYFPWVTLRLDPSSASSVSAFIALFSYRNKLRLLQQREYRNRGRQEQTKRAKMERKKRRLRLYGPQLPEGTSSRRRHVRTAADGTPIFDRSTRGENKLHCVEDQYELGRCAVCFQTDEEIRSKARWDAQRIHREWMAACREAVAMGYAPPPKPVPVSQLQPMQPAGRKKSSGGSSALSPPPVAIPPHVAAFHASNPLLRCCECEVEVHAKCLSRDHEVLVLGVGWVALPSVRVGDRVWSLQSFGKEDADWSEVIRAPIRYELAPGEAMVHVQTAGINLLATSDHNHWVRTEAGEWVQEHTTELGEERRFMTAGVSHAADHKWAESFLQSVQGELKQSAWCKLLGFVINGCSGDDDAIVLRASTAEVSAWLQVQLAILCWTESDPTAQQPFFSIDADHLSFHCSHPSLVAFVRSQQQCPTCSHDWRFRLSAAQSRSVLLGQAVAAGFLDSTRCEADQQARVARGLQKESSSIRSSTASVQLRDDLMLLAARAGWPASLSSAGNTWSLAYHVFASDSFAAQYTTVRRSAADRAYTPVQTADRSAWCIEVKTGNFLTRRNVFADSPSSTDSCHQFFTGNCYGVQYEEVEAQLQAQERRKAKLQRVVKMGTGAGAGSSSSSSVSFTPFSALSLQQELDELHAQFEDEVAEELEEAEVNTTQWKCRRCVEKDKDIACVLCQRKGGAFKKTDGGSWVHLVCAQWIPELSFVDNYTLEPVTGMDDISPARRRLKCYLCRRSGPCIECSEHTCSQAFHPMCGMLAGQLMLEIADSSNSSTFISSCRRHTQLHLARFIPLPQEYTNLVWDKKKLDNSRVMLEELQRRGEADTQAISSAMSDLRKSWSQARKDAVAPPPSTPSSAASTPAPSPTGRRRRGAETNASPMLSNSASMSMPAGSGMHMSSNINSHAAAAAAAAAVAQTPSWPQLLALEHYFPGLGSAASAQYTFDWLTKSFQGQQQQSGLHLGQQHLQSGGYDKQASNQYAELSRQQAAAIAALFMQPMSTINPAQVTPAVATAAAPSPAFVQQPITSPSSSSSFPSAPSPSSASSSAPSTARRSNAAPAAAAATSRSSPLTVVEEDDLPLSSMIPHKDADTAAASSTAATAARGAGRRAANTSAASAASSSSSSSSSASSSAAPATAAAPVPNGAAAAVPASAAGPRKRKSEDAALVEESKALLTAAPSKRGKTDTATSSTAAATPTASKRGRPRAEEKESR